LLSELSHINLFVGGQQQVKIKQFFVTFSLKLYKNKIIIVIINIKALRGQIPGSRVPKEKKI
jgi:hypothetical protein